MDTNRASRAVRVYQEKLVDVWWGDSRDLGFIPDESVHCAVTSPPYYGLRSYKGDGQIWSDGWEGQLGAEPDPSSYIQHLVEIFREVRRVLRRDGTFWLNIAGSYAGGNYRGGGADSASSKQLSNFGTVGFMGKRAVEVPDGFKPLDMIPIPFMLAIALQADGWWLRSDVLWIKPNPMPISARGWRYERHKIRMETSERAENSYRQGADQDLLQGAGVGPGVQREAYFEEGDGASKWADCPGCPKCSPTDGFILRKGNWRPTPSHEYVLLLAKSGNYFLDGESVLEPSHYDGRKKTKAPLAEHGREHYSGADGHERWPNPGGRNMRDVWTLATDPLPSHLRGTHYAAFPRKLVENCVRAGTSEHGVCSGCGSPFVRVIQSAPSPHTGKTATSYDKETMTAGRLALLRQAAREQGGEYQKVTATIGWRPSCKCPDPSPIPSTVLDPFGGSGTTAFVAREMGRMAISVDCSMEYSVLSIKRLVGGGGAK